MEIKIAQIDDIDDILKLHYKYQIDSIKQEDKKDGFVTTTFTKEQLESLITKEQGIFIARNKNEVLAYIMCASWDFWSAWPMFVYMINDLENLSFKNQTITKENSYQYGPVCIHKDVRGQGILEEVFEFARIQMAKKYPILITFINKINPRSFEAHRKKLGLEVIQEFTYNDNNYYELVYDTSKSLK